MCNECCKEFKGWCKSFTPTEAITSVLEAILLVVFFAFLIFLILHLVACSQYHKCGGDKYVPLPVPVPVTVPGPGTDDEICGDGECAATTEPSPDDENNLTSEGPIPPGPDTATTSKVLPSSTKTPKTPKTPGPSLVTAECTWEPVNRTRAPTRYYEETDARTKPRWSTATYAAATDVDALGADDAPDGEPPAAAQRRMVLALVKPGAARGGGGALGCVLTAVAPRWALTAASCLEAVEEVDSLDSFVMVADWGADGADGAGGAGEAGGVAVDDVRVYPRYSLDRAADLAALRGERPLPAAAAALPALADYFLLTPGERLTLLGFGRYRLREGERSGGGGEGGEGEPRMLRAAAVYASGGAACAGWAPRHLAAAGALERGRGGAGALCAGPLRRGAGRAGAGPGPGAEACGYCGGAPLLRGRTLLAVMADNPQCGVSCEPALFVNVALAADWIEGVINSAEE